VDRYRRAMAKKRDQMWKGRARVNRCPKNRGTIHGCPESDSTLARACAKPGGSFTPTNMLTSMALKMLLGSVSLGRWPHFGQGVFRARSITYSFEWSTSSSKVDLHLKQLKSQICFSASGFMGFPASQQTTMLTDHYSRISHP
jgi:hypothetical protein